MATNRERSSYDLKTLAHVMEQSTGVAEVLDTTPVLRADIIDGLQRFLAKRAQAKQLLEQCGYYDLIKESNAILDSIPALEQFLGCIQEHRWADANHAGTDPLR